MPHSKEYFKDLETLVSINKDIVSKTSEKNHKDTTPRRRDTLEKELKNLYQKKEELKTKLNNYHARD